MRIGGGGYKINRYGGGRKDGGVKADTRPPLLLIYRHSGNNIGNVHRSIRCYLRTLI